ncbi:MAG: tetratricopeptide repeat protein [Patescibacteria group bacterium]
MKKWFKENLIYLFFLTFLVVVAYANSLNNVFLSDDLAEIVQNPNVGDLAHGISTYPFGFIRPLLYWVAYQLGGLNPSFFRFINIFFHTGSVFLIFAILNQLQSKKSALFVAAVFAVHPAISEAVVWISGGSYPQYSFFLLLSFLFYILSSRRKFFYLLSSIFYLLSLMSHPVMPLGLFLVFPAFELTFGNLRKNWLKAIPFLLISIVYVFINLAAIPERTTTLQSTHYQEKGVDNLFLIIPIAISSYFELIFWPETLTLYHSELSFGPINFAVRSISTLLFFVAIAITFVKNRKICFWLSFSLIALSPTLTPFRFNWIVAERYLYLPILGILTAVAILAENYLKFLRSKLLIYTFFILIIAALSIRTFVRNIDWKNEDNLWIATGKTSPSSPNTHNNLGDVYGRWGNKQRALQEFQTAIALKPNYGDAHHNLANTYRELGQLDKALENYQKAASFNPNLWQSYQNIAALYFEAKEYDKALENIQKAIQINPKNLNLYNNLGIVYLFSGQKDKAKEVFNLVLSSDPKNQFASQGLLEASK